MTLIMRLPHVFGPRWPEWTGSFSALLAGMGLLHPYPAFENNDAFAMFTWAPEWVWGLVLISVGILRLVGLIINGRRKRITPWVRFISAFVCFMLWLGFTIGLLASGVMSTWPGAWPVLCVTEFVNMQRASQDARIGYGGPG